MNRFFSAPTFVAAALVAAGAFVSTAAQARTDVTISLGMPIGHVQHVPVYVQQRPVYVQPAYAYGYDHDRRGHRHAAWRDSDRDGVPNIYDRDSRHYDPRAAHRANRGAYGDADRDGVPNRWDEAPRNPYRR